MECRAGEFTLPTCEPEFFPDVVLDGWSVSWLGVGVMGYAAVGGREEGAFE